MPTPVYVALHSVATNLNMAMPLQAALVGNTAMHNIPGTQKAGQVANLIGQTYAWMSGQAAIAGHAATALYIYMGPEYLLQESYAQRSVTEDDKSQIVNQLAATSAACPGMLVMPGTLVWRKKKGFGRALLNRAADAYNSAFIFWNGAMVHRHDKNNNVGELKAADQTKAGNFGTRNRAVFVGGAQAGRFACNGLQWGVEICGDHGMGTLANGGLVDLHLLTSAMVAHHFNAAGMLNIAARDGGIFVHCNDYAGRPVGSPFHGAWEIDRTGVPQAVPGVAIGGAPPVNVVGFRLTLN